MGLRLATLLPVGVDVFLICAIGWDYFDERFRPRRTSGYPNGDPVYWGWEYWLVLISTAYLVWASVRNCIMCWRMAIQRHAEQQAVWVWVGAFLLIVGIAVVYWSLETGWDVPSPLSVHEWFGL
jgi:hypothetical protein